MLKMDNPQRWLTAVKLCVFNSTLKIHKTKFSDSHGKIDKINHYRKKIYVSFPNINCFINVIHMFKEYI